MDFYLIPALIVLPLAAAAVILLFCKRMSGKVKEDKKLKKEKREKISSKLGTEPGNSSQEPTKGGKDVSDERNQTLSSSCSTEEQPTVMGGKTDGTSTISVSAAAASKDSCGGAEKSAHPPAKPKRRTKGKNTVAGELEKSSKQGSSFDEQSLQTDEAVSLSLTAEQTATHAGKSTQKREKQKMLPSKSVDQSKYTEMVEKSTEDRKMSLPSSVDNAEDKAKSVKSKVKDESLKPEGSLVKSEMPKTEELKLSKTKESKLPKTEESKIPKMEESKSSKIEASKSSKNEASKSSKIEASKSSKIEESKATKIEETESSKIEETKSSRNQEPKPPIRKVEPKPQKSRAAPEPPLARETNRPDIHKEQITPINKDCQELASKSEAQSHTSKSKSEKPIKVKPRAPIPDSNKSSKEASLLSNIAEIQMERPVKPVEKVDIPRLPVEVIPKSGEEIKVDYELPPSEIPTPLSVCPTTPKVIKPSPVKNDQQESRKLAGFLETSSEKSNSNSTVNVMDDNSTFATASKSGQTQVRVLTLNAGDNLENTLYRLQKGYILQIRPGPSLFGKKTNVFTNCPKSLSESFDRTKYRKLTWKNDSLNRGDDTALFVEIQIQSAGSFHYYLTIDDCTEKEFAEASGYFLVDPVLTTGQNGEILPLDSIQCQTFMSKCLGKIDRWPKCLQVAKEAGYNMIHFTPVQELGASRSGYSLRDQLKLNPEFSPAGKQYTLKDVKKIVDMMDNDWKVLSITDIVLNHTSFDADWILDHPECSFNLVNSPHLRPAYVLDRVIWHFGLEIIDGKWESKGIPKELVKEQHIQAMEHVLHNEILHKLKVEEYFLVDVDSLVEQFCSKMKDRRRPSIRNLSLINEPVDIIPDPLWRRFKSTVDLDMASQQFNTSWADINETDRRNECCRRFRMHLEQLNASKSAEIRQYVSSSVNCISGTVRYERLQGDGPKIKEVSKKHPLVPKYFNHFGGDSTVEEEEESSFGLNASYIMAHNGWVMGYDPLKNFAAPGSNVCLKRELNAWGDSIKLRYGDKPEDCPYLWDRMRQYVEETARTFHGIRLDNCHSTPINIAEYLLDCARIIRPNFYVIAELFTSSEQMDNQFVNRLGISSLIREALSAHNSHEEGRLVYRYGGEPVGGFILPPVRPLMPSIAHAMFLDITHDNQSPCQIRTAWDMLPSTSLVNMACCASGSTRGYDEIVPHHIHVVNEERKYPTWSDDDILQGGTINKSSGILSAKIILNNLHYDLGVKGFSQIYVDQVTEHIVTVTRHNPVSHESVVLVAFTSFRPPSQIGNGYIRPLSVQGKVDEILFELKVSSRNEGDKNNPIPGKFVKDEEYINGIDVFEVEVHKSLQPKDATFVRQISAEGAETSEFEYTSNFTPGSVIAFKLSLLPDSQKAIGHIRSLLSDFGYKQKISEIENCNKMLLDIVKDLSLSDLNRILYRCEQEESDEGRGWSSYSVPNLGNFTYCGLQGIISKMSGIRVSNDLGHPICSNLRDGFWLTEYIVGRLKLEKSTEKFAFWLEDKLNLLKQIPKYLIPAYFDAVITAVYLTLINHAWTSMSKFISNGSGFAKALSLCSVQFCGVVKSALLPKLSPNLKSPRPLMDIDRDQNPIETSVTISAGLPHFAVGYLRNWGRDTFIALPGNLLVTGRYDEARWIILAFAATLRHGLIPNLLDGGAKARYNCRDAVWFWLYSIQRYVDTAPNGHEILKDKVSRLFPKDNSEPVKTGLCDELLEEVMQEALQRHFEGVQFRERNAGRQIDSQMNDGGFNNQIGVDLDTGFPFGGNEHNCGTWMDKMGSSPSAGNKGKPATPRDGSAVEIVGLCKSTVKFLGRMHSKGQYSYGGVTRKDEKGNEIEWSFKFWDNQIRESFEKHFWILAEPGNKSEKRPDLINRRGIYKDTVGASQPWADFQLRCNFPIALAVAPDLVSSENGKMALAKAEELLLGPLGMKTLDPKDWAYRGDYDNSNNGSDPSVAHGFNYHQGPEWLWPVGWFLRAKLAVASNGGCKYTMEETISEIKSILAPRFTHLLSTEWRSLPELTNSNGSYCRDSNPAQAWSTGCLLEVLWDMHLIGEKLNITT